MQTTGACEQIEDIGKGDDAGEPARHVIARKGRCRDRRSKGKWIERRCGLRGRRKGAWKVEGLRMEGRGGRSGVGWGGRVDNPHPDEIVSTRTEFEEGEKD